MKQIKYMLPKTSLHTLRLTSRDILYTLELKNVKNINLRVRPDCTVYVSAPRGVSVGEIESFIKRNDIPICRALERYASLPPYAKPSFEYKNGDEYRILGHRVIIRTEGADRSSVSFEAGRITLRLTDEADEKLRKRVFERWLSDMCRETVTEICAEVYPRFVDYNIEFPQLAFRFMKSRWGSCHTDKGKVVFNTALITRSVECIEYVAAHELAHFVCPNHSKRFYSVMTSVMPDWRTRKKKLNDI